MLLTYLFVLTTAASPPDACSTADTAAGAALIRRAVEQHGAQSLQKATVEFAFRNNKYRMSRDNGRYRYEAWLNPGYGRVHGVLHNGGASVTVDGQPVPPQHRLTLSVRESINSVVYFASLPLPLRDPAVLPCRRPSTSIQGRKYDVLEVRFKREGGGQDYQDVFLYWISKKGRIDYMAYRFLVNGGGVRFRVATKFHSVGQMQFIDWDNYEHPDKRFDLSRLPRLFEEKKLKKLSEIKLTDIRFAVDRRK